MNRKDDWGVVLLAGALTLAFGWSYFQPLPKWISAVVAIFFGTCSISFAWILFLERKRPRVEVQR